MKLSSLEFEADSWAFALDIYARPGIAEACLKLQNEAGVDVLILLLVGYAAVRHRLLLTALEIRELDAACRPWREQIVLPLRAIRSGLKTGPLPAPSSGTEPFRSKVKAIELAAERLQNQLMAECLPRKSAERSVGDPNELRSVLLSVVSHFLQARGGGQIADLTPAIDKIVEAARHDRC